MEAKPNVPAGDHLLGRQLDAYGRPTDGGVPLDSMPARIAAPTRLGATQPANTMLESGIKAIDFYAPLLRGGVAVLEGRPGTGMIVVSSELAHNLYVRHGGRIVMALLDTPGWPAREVLADLRHAGVLETAVVVVAAHADGVAAHTALDIAAQFAAAGHTSVLVVDEPLLDEQIATQLRGNTSGVTTLVWRMIEDDTPTAPRIVEPDAVVVLRPELGRRQIWPAVDPLASRSRLLDGALDATHQLMVERVRSLLQRIDIFAAGAAPHGAEAGRAQRALLFQTQPFSVAELFTARPGVYVDTADTVAGFAAIANGAYDDVAASELSFLGALPARDS